MPQGSEVGQNNGTVSFRDVCGNDVPNPQFLSGHIISLGQRVAVPALGLAGTFVKRNFALRYEFLPRPL